MGGNTFNKRDMELISKEYFEIIKMAPCYIELMSKCTGHCWIVHKMGYSDKFPYWLYHKYRREDLCYHLQRKKGSIKATIEEIRRHDLYQSQGRKNVFNNENRWSYVKI